MRLGGLNPFQFGFALGLSKQADDGGGMFGRYKKEKPPGLPKPPEDWGLTMSRLLPDPEVDPRPLGTGSIWEFLPRPYPRPHEWRKQEYIRGVYTRGLSQLPFEFEDQPTLDELLRTSRETAGVLHKGSPETHVIGRRYLGEDIAGEYKVEPDTAEIRDIVEADDAGLPRSYTAGRGMEGLTTVHELLHALQHKDPRTSGSLEELLEIPEESRKHLAGIAADLMPTRMLRQRHLAELPTTLGTAATVYRGLLNAGFPPEIASARIAEYTRVPEFAWGVKHLPSPPPLLEPHVDQSQEARDFMWKFYELMDRPETRKFLEHLWPIWNPPLADPVRLPQSLR